MVSSFKVRIIVMRVWDRMFMLENVVVVDVV